MTYTVYRYSRVSKSNINITNYVIGLPNFTDTGSGEVNSAVIVLSSANGRFITDSDPILDYDLLFIADEDPDGGIYQRVFQVRRRRPVKSKGGGASLEIHASGLEWTLQFKNYAFNFFSSDAFSVAKDIQREYNENSIHDPSDKNSDPLMKGLDDTTNNQLPDFTSNNYSFANNEDKCYNRLLQVTDIVAAPGDLGGIFEYFEIGTKTDLDLTNEFTMKIFPSGSHDSGVILVGSVGTNLGESEGGLDGFQSSVKNAWGDINSGSIPLGWSKFSGGQLAYSLYPEWHDITPNVYPHGALVSYLGSLWTCIVPNGDQVPGPGLFWNEMTTAGYYGDQFVFSEWTNGQLAKWMDCGSNIGDFPIGRYFDLSSGFFDGNLVINTRAYQRTWVDYKISSESGILTVFQYANSSNPNNYYIGMRFLVDENASGIFAGADINGVPYKNNIIQYFGDNFGGGNGWIVVKQAQQNMTVAVIYTGKAYVFDDVNFTPSGVWTDLTDSSIAYPVLGGSFSDGNVVDCFHPYNGLEQDDIQFIPPDFTKNQKSAIKVTYEWVGTVIPLLNIGYNANWYRFGAWASFRFPFAPNIWNEPSHFVGEAYGSSAQLKGPSTLDAANMSYSFDGSTGFSTEQCEWLGPLSSLDFLIRLRATYTAIKSTSDIVKSITGAITAALTVLGGAGLAGNIVSSLTTIFEVGDILAEEADFKMRCVVYDINDNVVSQDFVIPFNDEPKAVKLPLSGFSPYVCTKPLNGLGDMVSPPIEPATPAFEFEWRHIKQISIFTAESYDDHGRYSPEFCRYNANFKSQLSGAIQLSPAHKLEMWIDGFRFTKPLLVNSGTLGEQVINTESEFSEHPDVLSYQQLKSIVKEEYFRETYPHKEYDITTTLRYDIKFGDSFYYYDPLIVENNPITGHGELAYPDTSGQMPSDATHTGGFYDFTVKLVAKKIDYSYTKPQNGEGGALRTIMGVKVFGVSG